MAEPIIRVEGLTRIFHTGGEDVHAVDDITLDVAPHQMTAIVGPSGAGKTTFLNLVAGLDDPTGGRVWFQGRPLDEMSHRERLDLRRAYGFIFQTFGLLPLLSAAENVGVPLRMRRVPSAEREARVAEALAWVGLAERARHRPYELSGGEQQRVAVARALAARPTVILADEPTGQLDSQTGLRIVEILRRVVDEHDITVVVATHDVQVMAEADVVHEILDGKLIDTRHKGAPRDGKRPEDVLEVKVQPPWMAGPKARRRNR
jgi:putative ABC transport system ATP-binding protein